MADIVTLGSAQRNDWLSGFPEALGDPAAADRDALFAAEANWRDIVAMSWTIDASAGAAITVLANASATITDSA